MNDFGSEIQKEAAKAIVKVSKDVIEDIVKPSSKSIGTNIGLMVDGVFGWLGCWGEKQKIKQQVYVEDFKKSISNKVESISEENLQEPIMSITGPALESSKFFYEEEYYREMFSNLIAASCDKNKNKIIHPSYTEIIKQLSPLDAKLLGMFKYNSTYPIGILTLVDKENKITPSQQYLFDFKDKSNEFILEEYPLLTACLENLVRLGIVIKNKEIIELNYNYEDFRKNIFYLGFSQLKQNETDKINITPYRIELSNYGKNFINICF